VCVVLLALAALVGCEDTEQCVPLNTSCTDASKYSDYYSMTVQCCEGSCIDVPPPPGSQGSPTTKECR